MFQRLITYCATLTFRQVALFGFLLAIPIEAATAFTRFGLKLQSTRDTEFLSGITFRLRIHHGYIGVFLWLLAWWLLRKKAGLRNAVWVVAFALIISDLMHHFLVLWPITGSPEFDLLYPLKKLKEELKEELK